LIIWLYAHGLLMPFIMLAGLTLFIIGKEAYDSRH
jgi:hypothetical protein